MQRAGSARSLPPGVGADPHAAWQCRRFSPGVVEALVSFLPHLGGVPVLIAAPSPTTLPSPAPPTADALPPDKTPPRSRRRWVRRVVATLLLSVIGYALLWGGVAGGILLVSAWARDDHISSGQRTAAGINHFLRVDAKVWRGSAPNSAGYRELAHQGIRTVVDLRAEKMSAHGRSLPAQAGLTAVRLPIRDGQTPTERQVDTFLKAVRQSPGPVYVHCGAGVGRTGAMSAAYLVGTAQATSEQAAKRNLAVGPPSVEQIYYALNVSADNADNQPPDLIKALSRALDAPRRILSYL